MLTFVTRRPVQDDSASIAQPPWMFMVELRKVTLAARHTRVPSLMQRPSMTVPAVDTTRSPLDGVHGPGGAVVVVVVGGAVVVVVVPGTVVVVTGAVVVVWCGWVGCGGCGGFTPAAGATHA